MRVLHLHIFIFQNLYCANSCSAPRHPPTVLVRAVTGYYDVVAALRHVTVFEWNQKSLYDTYKYIPTYSIRLLRDQRVESKNCARLRKPFAEKLMRSPSERSLWNWRLFSLTHQEYSGVVCIYLVTRIQQQNSSKLIQYLYIRISTKVFLYKVYTYSTHA